MLRPGLDGDHEQIDQLGHATVDSVEPGFRTPLNDEARHEPAHGDEEKRGEDREGRGTAGNEGDHDPDRRKRDRAQKLVADEHAGRGVVHAGGDQRLPQPLLVHEVQPVGEEASHARRGRVDETPGARRGAPGRLRYPCSRSARSGPGCRWLAAATPSARGRRARPPSREGTARAGGARPSCPRPRSRRSA